MALLRSNKLRLAAITGAATAALVGGLTALPAQAAQATGTVLAAGSPTAVDGSYIVTLKKSAGLTASSTAGKGLVKEYGGTVTKTFGTVLNGYTASLSATEAKRLAADPAVAAVEQNQRVHLTDTTQSSAPWGLDRIDQAALPLSGTYTYPDSAGGGVTVYVIDTGVRITHTQISGRAVYGYDAVDGDTTASDGNGHGTHVATTIAGSTYGVAKKANIVAVRVLDNSGSGTTAGVIAGIDWVTSNHTTPAVANMSLGGSASTSLDTAVANSISSGVTYAVAAGNSSANASSYSPPGSPPRSRSAPPPARTPGRVTPTTVRHWTSSRPARRSWRATTPATPPPPPCRAPRWRPRTWRARRPYTSRATPRPRRPRSPRRW